MPLDYYFMIAAKAFEFGENYYKDSYLIHEQYITFLSLLLYQTSQNKTLTPDCFRDEIIQQAMSVKWSEFYKTYQNQSHPKNICTGQSSRAELTNKRIYVFVPIGIPGMGKSHLIRTLKRIIETNKGHFSMVSSDGVRQECMERLAKIKRNLTKEALFDQTGREAKDLFDERLEKLVSSWENIQSQTKYIFIDKNHPPGAIKPTLTSLRKYARGELEIIAVTPLIEEDPFSYDDNNKSHKYPFSAEFFFNCLDRVQKRKEHETLPGSGTKSAGVLLMFLNLFRNINLNKGSILKNGFDRFLTIPFTSESKQNKISHELLQKLADVLRTTKPGDKCNDELLLSTFLKAFEKNDFKFQFPDSKIIESSIQNFLQEIFAEDDERGQIKSELLIEGNIDNQTKENFEEKKLQNEGNIQTKEISKNFERYNPKKIPIYLGLFTTNNPLDFIQKYILNGLKDLSTVFPQDQILNTTYEVVKNNDKKSLDFVKDFHVTTLFIGNNLLKKETEYFQTFKPGHQMDIELVGLVIVPNKIVTAICYPDQSTIKIENKFPHMTLMTGEWPPKNSNVLFESLFGENGPLNSEYEEKNFLTEKNFALKSLVSVAKDNVTVYIIQTPKAKLPVIADICL